jgi:hypothetical protein
MPEKGFWDQMARNANRGGSRTTASYSRFAVQGGDRNFAPWDVHGVAAVVLHKPIDARMGRANGLRASLWQNGKKQDLGTLGTGSNAARRSRDREGKRSTERRHTERDSFSREETPEQRKTPVIARQQPTFYGLRKKPCEWCF